MKGGWSGPVWRASVVGMMAALAACVPELGPPSEVRDAPQTVVESPGERTERATDAPRTAQIAPRGGKGGSRFVWG